MNKESLAEQFPNRAKLLKYLKSNKYVFHGSPYRIQSFEPRQAFDGIENPVPDGPPAVFASKEIEIPIFMAIVNSVNAPLTSQSGFSMYHGEKPSLRITLDTLEQAKTGKGFVYVFEKKFFKHRRGMEWTCENSISPVDSVPVAFQDIGLPLTIIKPGKTKRN
jgi:hypothetical protein